MSNPDQRGSKNVRWKGGRTMIRGYVGVRMPDHPRGTVAGGYVLEHVLIAERALGRGLPSGCHVHHVNGDRADNRGSNLVICEDAAYHSLLHVRTRAREECGRADWLKCGLCGEYDDPKNLWVHPRKKRAHHNRCHREGQRERARARRAA